MTNSHKLSFFLSIFVLIVLTSACFGEEQSGGYASDFLDYGIGARALGMASAGRSFSDDCTAGYWNSALLPSIATPSISFMRADLLANSKYTHIGILIPILGENVAFNYVAINTDGLELHTGDVANSTPAGYFSDAKSAIFLSYGKEILPDISIGTTLKYASRKLYISEDNLYGADIGFLWKKDIFAIAANLNNIVAFTTGDTSDKYNMDLAFAGSIFLDNKWLLEMDVARIFRSAGNPDVYGGLEYQLLPHNGGFGLSLRCGLNNIERTVGFGLSVYGMSIDYAYGFGTVENLSRLSVKMSYDPSWVHGATGTAHTKVAPIAQVNVETETECAAVPSVNLASATQVPALLPATDSITIPSMPESAPALPENRNSLPRTALDDAIDIKLLTGYPDNTLRPNKLITKEECLIVVHRLVRMVTGTNPEQIMALPVSSKDEYVKISELKDILSFYGLDISVEQPLMSCQIPQKELGYNTGRFRRQVGEFQQHYMSDKPQTFWLDTDTKKAISQAFKQTEYFNALPDNEKADKTYNQYAEAVYTGLNEFNYEIYLAENMLNRIMMTNNSDMVISRIELSNLLIGYLKKKGQFNR
ncbi:MAG: hypothetical protein DKM50_00320 [Candidatus Margulisiibacteriota bacterium]|nr:MAG: hypothetical protein DKM50_00320 [Candidatus Margulisiibacteriota bacterium]